MCTPLVVLAGVWDDSSPGHCCRLDNFMKERLQIPMENCTHNEYGTGLNQAGMCTSLMVLEDVWEVDMWAGAVGNHAMSLLEVATRKKADNL